MGLGDFFKKRLFFRKKKKESLSKEEERRLAEERLDRRLVEARERLNAFLITRKTARGRIKKTSQWELFRTAPGLFRLDADGLSILINTAPFLVEQKGKIQGLLHTSEWGLCTASESKGLADFLSHFEPPDESFGGRLYADLTGESRTSEGFSALPALSSLLSWEPFDLDQMIVRNSQNTLAHVLIHADTRLESLLRSRFSMRLLLMLAQEIESLLAGAGRGRANPHSRQRPLEDFEAALKEFRSEMRDYLFLKNRDESRKRT